MKLTTDGIYPLNLIKECVVDKTAIYVSGNAGGGTLTVGYTDDYGTFIPLEEGVLTVGTQGVFFHGFGMNLHAQLAGASGAALSIRVAGVK